MMFDVAYDFTKLALVEGRGGGGVSCLVGIARVSQKRLV